MNEEEKERILKGLRYLNADLSAFVGNNYDGSLICPIYNDEELMKLYNEGANGATHYDAFIKKEQNKCLTQ